MLAHLTRTGTLSSQRKSASFEVEDNSAARSRSVFGFLREVFLTVIATAGFLCLAALIAGVIFHISFVVFRTGSMEPKFPVGALSLVIETPAAALRPGDVASVMRENSTVLVTHRVMEVNAVPGSRNTVELVLRGDANSVEDPFPYRVQTAKKVFFTVPVLGQWIMAVRGPGIIGASSVLLAALVVWAFWPKRSRPRHRSPVGVRSRKHHQQA
jgi:signal peptidase I